MKLERSALAAALGVAMLFAAGCAKDDTAEGKSTTDSMMDSAKDAMDEAKDAADESMESLKETLEAKKAELQQLEDKAATASEDMQADIQAQIDKLKMEIADLQKKIGG